MLNQLSRYAPIFLAVLRIVAGLLFLEHGTQKLFGFPPGEHAGAPIYSIYWVAGVLELVLGVLLVLGLFTRPAAFLASGEMAVAYWMSHAPQDFYPVNNGGDASILFCFIFLYLVFAGPGRFSLDQGRTAGSPRGSL
jgi:putative oxidoreductase